MPPTLLLIRHAQALHNVASDWTLHDPPLSALGEQQCTQLQHSLRDVQVAQCVELVLVSPMRRALQTANLGLGWLIEENKVPVVVDAAWQENADKPCDTGSPIPILAREFPSFDFSHVDPIYPNKTTDLHTNPYAFTRAAIFARGQACLRALYLRPEKVIAVVSHSGFMRAAVCQRRFSNADWRVFDFDASKTDDPNPLYHLKEWGLTEQRGGGMGRSEKGVFGAVDDDFPPER